MHLLLIALALSAPDRARIGPFEDETVAAAEPDEADDGEEGDDGEADIAEPEGFGPDIKYSADLSDDELQRRWKSDLDSLGSISVGFADNGRLINGARMP